jgi:hypothetical protein
MIVLCVDISQFIEFLIFTFNLFGFYLSTILYKRGFKRKTLAIPANTHYEKIYLQQHHSLVYRQRLSPESHTCNYRKNRRTTAASQSHPGVYISRY